MKKLTAEDGARQDPQEQLLRDLVRSAEPFTPSPFAKRSVYHRVTRAGSTRWPRLVRAGALASVLFGGTAMASIAVGTYAWLRPAPRQSAAPSARPPLPRERQREPRAAAAPASVASQGSGVTTPLSASGSSPQVAATAARPAGKPVSVARKHAQRQRVSSLLPDESEDPAEIMQAVRALRRDHDPLQAQRLLDHYLAIHREGAFTEDALALAIEAASVRQDPAARSYARRYLAQFPSGRFRDLARRTLGNEP
jgi:hypothetical protein